MLPPTGSLLTRSANKVWFSPAVISEGDSVIAAVVTTMIVGQRAP